jgi:NAD(P)-dependent dehydrogenase (short-subunit alcohol dehydrogenase family)
MVHIEGSTAVVTGGQRGIGKAVVDELLERGASKVYATARAPKPSEDPRVVSIALDVTDPDSVAALAKAAADVQIVVNNAGTVGGDSLLGSLCGAVVGADRRQRTGWPELRQSVTPISRSVSRSARSA